jgi:lambda family phage tail tape measure protein
MAKIIAGLGAQLGLDTTEFKKGISEAKNSLKELKEYLPEALSAAAFFELIKSSLEFSRQIVDVAKANDVATASVLELSKALEENGGRADEATRVYSGFTAKVEAAAQGNAQAQESFARLGVTLDDLRHLSEQDLFAKTVDGLARMSDSAERNGLAFQTLGKAIKGVDIKGMSASLEESKGTMDKYAKSVEDAYELSKKLEEASHKFMLEFNNSVIPTLLAFYETLNKDNSAVKDFIYWIGEAVKVVAVMAKYVMTTVEVIFSNLNTLFETVKLGFKGKFSEIGDLWREEMKKTDAMVKSDAEFFDKLFGDKPKEEAPAEKKKNNNADRIVVDVNAAGLLSAKDLTAEYKRQIELMNTQLAQKDELTTLSKNQREQQAAENAVLDAQQKALDAIDKKIANLDKNKIGYKDVKEELLKAKENIKDITVFAQESAKNVVIANQKAQESFWMGWDIAYKNYIESTQTAADSGRQVFESLTSNMTKALEDFVATGKLSFSDLARSIISDLLKIYVKYQETQLFSALGDAYKGAGGAQGLLAGAKSLLGFADGGDPPVGVPSIVGENGPELFIPKTAGTVIPNSALSGMGGGGQTINYNGPFVQNLSAIDTQSGVQFLTQNKNVIWAANQSANRSIPMTR